MSNPGAAPYWSEPVQVLTHHCRTLHPKARKCNSISDGASLQSVSDVMVCRDYALKS